MATDCGETYDDPRVEFVHQLDHAILDAYGALSKAQPAAWAHPLVMISTNGVNFQVHCRMADGQLAFCQWELPWAELTDWVLQHGDLVATGPTVTETVAQAQQALDTAVPIEPEPESPLKLVP
jgi:hypothetical protein